MSASVGTVAPSAENCPAAVWLHRFAVLTAGATFILIIAGGLVTSTGSALAVPDWPLSYGGLFPPMVGGILYEHGHRMVGAFVGLLTTVLAVWLVLKEPRRWVRWLGLGALTAVCAQGILGGLTVLYLLPTPISVGHACLAQIFFCLVISLALFTSPEWKAHGPRAETGGKPSFRGLCVATTAVIFVQLVLGAVMRHTEAGLAIPDFPMAFGHIVPPLSSLPHDPNAPFPVPPEVLRQRVLIHFAHRLGAVAVAACVVWAAVRVLRKLRDHPEFLWPALLLGGLVLVQIILGALTVWTGKAVAPTTAHVAIGALVLGTSLVLTLRSYKPLVSLAPVAGLR